ncbi:MAG: ThuA domain-containing protein [Bacteroidota bacterium]
MVKKALFICIVLLSGILTASAQKPRFRVLVVASDAKDHVKMITAARPFFLNLGKENNFAVDFTDDSSIINDLNLSRYQVFVMLHLAPFDMKPEEQAALQRFIEEGKGWVGIHAAGLTGQTFGNARVQPYWQWFEDFMGGITYSPHPAFQKGTLLIEDRNHPATKDMPSKIEISDEWYEWSKSPRNNVRVLAVADELSYKQTITMGDHPLIWTNERYPKTIYIGVGHDPSVLENPDYVTLLKNSIVWGASKKKKM